MSSNAKNAVLVRFLLLFAALNLLGVVYPPEGGLSARVLAAGALTLLAAALALVGGGVEEKPDRGLPGE